MTAFNGIWVPLVTPFRNGTIDFVALRALVERVTSAGASGLVVCGSTGEAAALDKDEQLQVLDAVLEVAPCPVVMGLGSDSQRDALRRLHSVQQRSVAGLLVPPPSYIKPSQAGVLAYLNAIADASMVPVIVYNVPYRTGVGIALETYRALAAHPRIVATKDCGGDLMLTMNLIADGRLQVLAGEDANLLATLALGGSGGILASAHLRTDLFAQVCSLAQQGKLAEARKLFYRLLPMIGLLFEEPNPAPLKTALGMMEWMREELREPMLPVSPGLREHLAKELQQLECLRTQPRPCHCERRQE